MKYIEEMSRKGISYKKYNSEFGAKILGKYGWKEGEGLGKTKSGITEAIQIKRREENMGLGKKKNEVIWNDKWWENSYDNILKGMKTVKNEDKGYNLRNSKEKNNERKNSEELGVKKRKNSTSSKGKKERKDSINSTHKKERKNSTNSRGKKERKDSINSSHKKERKNSINSNNKSSNKKERKSSQDNLDKNNLLNKKRKITFIDI